MKKLNIIILSFLMLAGNTFAQEKMSINDAIQLALTNNHNLKAVAVNKEQANNNATAGMAGLLPSVTANATADYSNNDTEMEFMNTGAPSDSDNRMVLDNAASTTYDANIRMDYVLFNGNGNRFTLNQLRESATLEEIRFKQEVETTVLQVVEAFYDISREQENLNISKETIVTSNKRLERLKNRYLLGQSTKLEVLNAEVDLNSDSTSYLQTEQAYYTAIRKLNVVLGGEVNALYEVDSDFDFIQGLSADVILDKAMTENLSLLAQQKQEEITELDLKIAKASKVPTVSTYASYGYNRMNNDAGQVLYSENLGMQAGVTMSFNVFNGHQQKKKEQNAKLNVIAQQETTMQLTKELQRDVMNAWSDYDYKQRIANMEAKSMEQAEMNFRQTKEQYELGQVTSIDFRTAQTNLQTAKNRLNDALYNAKVAEYSILQLSGDLLDQINE
ncbi:TolC family protein [Flammeovirga yaeyamensis]|uniref:TolC family protein n=1 Tax=Flammeovirga yaeyamensis TaxID=367791 RepID=A0AAX1N469_9BACT|nr:TolC family protein [Flammeovirga yaeyamensis]MBB3699721.1 outer membrane protein TolC [Flammeovirga yaeyamensis]NMF36709.1 TolC family protein [Flammeovirga yaeyamensis]QWG02247.1 TolC family protein [Flammeovirga yaeyamensis]